MYYNVNLKDFCHSVSATFFVVVVEVKPSGPVFRDEGSDVVLECEVYGYPRDSSPPVWTWSGGDLQCRRFTISVTNAPLLNDSSISSSQSVVSKLTISNATEGESGEYTCSVEGNATSVSITIGGPRGIVKIMNNIHIACMDVSCPLSFLDR